MALLGRDLEVSSLLRDRERRASGLVGSGELHSERCRRLASGSERGPGGRDSSPVHAGQPERLKGEV
jgi:hypothetical protein